MSTLKLLHTFISRRLLVLLVLLAFVALAACGGDEPAEEISVATEAASTEVAPTAGATEPTTAPESTAAPTEAPPTAASTETAAEPTPTLATAASTGALPSGDCGNPFYPVVEGRTLRYANNIPGFGVSEHTVTHSDVTDTSFTATTDLGDGDVLTQTWTCSGEGLLQPEFSQLPTGEDVTLTIEFIESSGLTIPAADQFQPGGSWTTHYVANATLSDTGAGEMLMEQTTDLTHTVIGPETITVPAGTFDALRVETTGTVSSATTVGDVSVPAMEFTMSFVSWYAEGVGLVRQEWTDLLGADSAATTELVAIE